MHCTANLWVIRDKEDLLRVLPGQQETTTGTVSQEFSICAGIVLEALVPGRWKWDYKEDYHVFSQLSAL